LQSLVSVSNIGGAQSGVNADDALTSSWIFAGVGHVFDHFKLT
jgi:hypothetical protein